jgi:hypothetical protein
MLWGMGWEERDWAKWTPEERKRYLGQSGSSPSRSVGGGDSGGGSSYWNQEISPSKAVAIGVSAVFVLLGSSWVGIGPDVFQRSPVSRPASIPHTPAPTVDPATQRLVCTQRTYDSATRQWRCTVLAYVDAEPVTAPQ